MSNLAAQIVSNLPDNPKLAIIEIKNRINSFIGDPQNQRSKISAQLIAIIAAWSEKHGKEAGWVFQNFTTANLNDKLASILSSVERFEGDVQVELAAAETRDILDLEQQIRNKNTFGIAVLSGDDKKKIRMHLENVRLYIHESDIPERKRVALLNRLSELEKELETLGTRTDRFFAFMGDAAFVVGDMAVKAKPFLKEVKDIMKIVLQGREDAEGTRLPGKFDDMLLPSPEE